MCCIVYCMLMIIQLEVDYDVDVVYSPENNSVTVGYYNLQAYMIQLFSVYKIRRT